MSIEKYEQPALFSLPRHITELPSITWAYIKIYETIFQFLCRGKTCFLSTKMIMERTGIASEGSVRGALAYFEKHNVLKRVMKGKRRYIVITMAVEGDEEAVDNPSNDSINSGHGVSTLTGGRQPTDGLPVSPLTHNNKIEAFNKNKEKSFLLSEGKTVDNFKPLLDKNRTASKPNKFWEPGNPDYDRVNAK